MTIDKYSELKLKYDALLVERGEIIDKYNATENDLANINQQIAGYEAELLNMLDDMRTEIQPDIGDINIKIGNFGVVANSTPEPAQLAGGSAISEDETQELADDPTVELELEE